MGTTLKSTTIGLNDGKFLTQDLKIPYLDRLPPAIDPKPLIPFLETISEHPHDFIMCSLMHPYTSSCMEGMLTSFYGELWRALKLYAPLNAVNFI